MSCAMVTINVGLARDPSHNEPFLLLPIIDNSISGHPYLTHLANHCSRGCKMFLRLPCTPPHTYIIESQVGFLCCWL